MTAPRRMTATGIRQAADVSPAAARGASEGARMVRALSKGRLHDRDRVVARARRRRDRVRHAPAADRRLSRRPRHPRPQILWVRALQGHTVLGRESRFFNCLRRRFRADRHVPGSGRGSRLALAARARAGHALPSKTRPTHAQSGFSARRRPKRPFQIFPFPSISGADSRLINSLRARDRQKFFSFPLPRNKTGLVPRFRNGSSAPPPPKP